MTIEQALSWINGGWQQSRFARQIPGLGLGIDVDGLFGFQCKDFSNGYADYIGNPFTGGNAIALWNLVQPGWHKVYEPEPGTVFVKDYYSDGVNYGHTGVVQEVVTNGFYSVDQNWFNSSLTVGSPPARVFHPNSSVKGYLKNDRIGASMPLNYDQVNKICYMATGMQADAADAFKNNVGLELDAVLNNFMAYNETRNKQLRADSFEPDQKKIKELEAEIATGGGGYKPYDGPPIFIKI